MKLTVESDEPRRWRARDRRQISRKGTLYGHPNDDFIISMILIDVAKEICR